MKVRIVTKSGVNIIRIEGAVKAGDEFTLVEKAEKYIKPNEAPKFIVDLKRVPFLNSAALGAFLNIYKHLDSLNGRIVFAGLNPEIEKLLEITHLSLVFEVFRNVGEALESFNF